MSQNNNGQDTQKQQEKAASKEAAGLVAKGAIDYATGGSGGAVYDQLKGMPVVGKKIDKAENKLGKRLNKASGGKFGKLAKKAKDTGALDAANTALSLGAGGAGGANAAGAANGANAAKEGANAGQNQGRNLLNNMGSNAKPQNKNNEEEQKRKQRLNRAIQVAKHIPIPQVQAVAKAADLANKTGALDKLGPNKGSDGDKKSSSIDIKSLIAKRRIIMIAAPSLLFLIILSTVVMGDETSNSAVSSTELNDGVCVVDYVKNEQCDRNSYNESFIDDVKSVRKEFREEGKDFNPLYIVGVYNTLKNAMDISYTSFTKSKIEEIANAMFKEEKDKSGNVTYTYDEDTFKENLKTKIFPKYIFQNDYSMMVSSVFEYVSMFEEAYGKEEIDESYAYDSDAANRLVQVAQEQLKESNSSRFGGYKYWKYLGFNSRVEWCACFVSWCANQAGITTTVIPHYSAVTDFYKFYDINKHGTFHSINSKYTPKPGDLIIWENKSNSNSKGISHIGIVEKVKDGKLYTIEGNSGYNYADAQGRKDRVAHNIYNSVQASGCTGFATPKYPAAATTVLKGKNTDQKVWNFFIGKKVTKETTAGIMGNLYRESGIDPNKHQYGGGPGRGIAQWEEGSDRYNNLVNMARKRNKSWNSLDVQLDYLWYELSGAETTCKSKMDRYYGGFNHFIKAKDIDWAVVAFERSFERASVEAMEERKSYARSYFKKYGGK